MTFRKIAENLAHKIELVDSSSRMKWVILCSFNIYVTFMVALNTFWLDEAHAALIIKDSGNLQGFIHGMRFEGAPWLWHLMVYVVFRIVGDVYVAMLFVHLLVWVLLSFVICYGLRLGAATISVILLSAPVAEYIMNVRQYPFSVLCLLSFAAIFIRWPRSLAAPLALFLLAQTSVNAFFISASLFLWLIFHFWPDRRLRMRNGLLLAGTAVCTVLQLIPDPHLMRGLRVWSLIGRDEGERFFPEFVSQISLLGTPAGFLLVLAVILGVRLLVVSRDRKGLALFALAMGCTLAGFLFIVVFKYRTLSRHHYLFPGLVLTLLVIGAARREIPLWPARLFLFAAIIAVAASLTTSLDRTIELMLRPKTQTENVAAYLRAHDPGSTLLLYHETDCEGMMFYLQNRYRYYSLDRDADIDRVIWDNEAVDNPISRGVFRSSDLAKLAPRIAQLPADLVARAPYLVVTANNPKNGGLADPFHFSAGPYDATIQRAFMSRENESFLIYKLTPLPR